jgi:two-component system cell cycle sensor histidine kinase/response regulator CckA
MTIRYSELDPRTSGVNDFVIRKHAPTSTQLFLLFITILLITFGGIMFIADKFTLAFILAGLLSAAGWYVVVQIQRNHDVVLATEFQNSLFASALGINNKFCMIIRRNGTVVYLDRMFQEMFPEFLHQTKRTIDVLLEQGKVPKSESEKVFTAIERGVFEKVVFEIRGSDNRFSRIVMSIEPILRPSGFILLRGREYVENRSSMEPTSKLSPSSLLNKNTITLFSYVMDTMNMGVYMTAPNGNIIYVNPVLEQWLGYRDGEILSGNLALQDIIQQNGKRPDSIEPDNFEGEVMLQKKTGGLMKSFINQKIIRDDDHKVMGCTALVHHFIDQNDNKKKKLW